MTAASRSATAIEFDFEAMTEGPVPLDRAVAATREGRYCWFDFDLDQAADPGPEPILLALGLDPATARDATAQRPDGDHDDRGDVVLVSVEAAEAEGETLATSPVTIVLGRSFLATIRRGDPAFLRRVRAGYRHDFRTFARSPGFLLYEIGDHLTGSYRSAARSLADRVGRLQRAVLDSIGDDAFARVATLSSDLAALRRTVLAAREALSALATRHSAAVPETTRPFLEKTVVALERIGADLVVERETLAEALNLALAVVGHRTNRVVNRLTVVSLVFLPLTFLCGVYGMNFKYLPELEWRHGYALFWLSAALIATATLTFMKRRGWW